MSPTNRGELRAQDVITQQLGDRYLAQAIVNGLRAAGIQLADEVSDELVCRWVNVLERAVPPEADTIIRTITNTIDGQVTSKTHWLDGLRSPRT